MKNWVNQVKFVVIMFVMFCPVAMETCFREEARNCLPREQRPFDLPRSRKTEGPLRRRVETVTSPLNL